MGVGAFLEPLVVLFLLFGGAWINRVANSTFSRERPQWENYDLFKEANTAIQSYRTHGELAINRQRSLSASLLPFQESTWRERDIIFWGL